VNDTDYTCQGFTQETLLEHKDRLADESLKNTTAGITSLSGSYVSCTLNDVCHDQFDHLFKLPMSECTAAPFEKMNTLHYIVLGCMVVILNFQISQGSVPTQVTCGLSKDPCRHKETWWWNDEVAEAVWEKKKKYRKWRKEKLTGMGGVQEE